ncbi:fibronectin type III domain-containing protein [Candidatus Peregrinibacteria bacterium]|nr:fibronectin type III domain-containing protein [Candidatus Peregrinibacteria bacterium]
MIDTIFKKLLIGVAIGASLASTAFAYDFESYGDQLAVSGSDTVSGFPTTLESSVVSASSSLVFKVVKPDGLYVELPATAGLDGVARIELNDFHTRIAGDYQVSAKYQGSSQYGASNVFQVIPGDMSEVYSAVTPSEQVVRIGNEYGEIEVRLQDMYGNSIPGHVVELISSRSSDVTSVDNNLTDQNGMSLFTVNSDESGVSSYSVYDLTANKILTQRAKVVYFDSNEQLFSNTQAFIGNAGGAASGPVAYLKFEDAPTSVNTGQALSFTLSARDESDQVVTDYAGTVQFSIASGSQTGVTLPNNYTYQSENLGSHPFALALSFATAGTYVVEARDVSDPTLFGTASITVNSAQAGISNAASITNPTPGTYSNNVQVISGTATAGASLVIYDNNIKVGDASASPTGTFSYTTGLMTDGSHEFYVAIINQSGTILASSPKVKITVDTTAPDLQSLEILPSDTVSSGGTTEVRLYAEPGLTQVLLDLNNAIFEMEESEDGYYSASFSAPILGGTYPLKFTLVDALGNESNIEEASHLLNVSNSSLLSGTTVGDVTGLVAIPGNHKLTLSWTPPSSGSPVQFYRISYGLSPNQLMYVIDTWDATTTWFIPDLHNDTEYFFAVAAVDNQGNISAHLSNIVSATPNSSYPDGVGQGSTTDVWQGTAGGENFDDMGEDVSDSGPEVVWLFLSAIFGGLFYTYFSTRRKEMW